MHLQSAQAQVFQPGRPGVNALDLLERDAEFVLVGAGGDFGVGVRLDVRIHAHGDRRNFLQPRGHPLDALQFRFALGVERINVLPQRKFNFVLRFSHARENAPARVAARRHDPPQFAPAHDVEAAAEVGERAQDGKIGIGFDREANEMLHRRHGAVELLKMVRQRALRIDVKRRAEPARERFHGDTFAEQFFADVTKIMHDDVPSLKLAALSGKAKARRREPAGGKSDGS